MTPAEALELVESIGRPVANSELAVWLGLAPDESPSAVLTVAAGGARLVLLDWDPVARAWWWNDGPESPGLSNRSPLEGRDV